jgi:uncharacterized protein (DUF433 family)
VDPIQPAVVEWDAHAVVARTGRKEVVVVTAFDRITVDPSVMNGQPCIRGMRLTVKRVVSLVARDLDRETLRADHPELEDEDIRQALDYAACMVEDRWTPIAPVGSS